MRLLAEERTKCFCTINTVTSRLLHNLHHRNAPFQKFFPGIGEASHPGKGTQALCGDAGGWQVGGSVPRHDSNATLQQIAQRCDAATPRQLLCIEL